MKKRRILLTDQRNDEIVLCDLPESAGESSNVLWRWAPGELGDMEFPAPRNRRLDSVTVRSVEAGLFHGPVMGVTKSGGMIAVLEYPSGKCLFNVSVPGFGPHDIDILPNGCVAVACSGNGDASKSELQVYRAQSKNETALVSVPFPHAHGVLWDPTEEVLWCLGGGELRAYRIEMSFEGMPNLSRVKDKGISGFCGAHCLSPVYGNPDRLWISDSTGVYQYSKSADALCHSYPGQEQICIPKVKSVNNYPDGTVILTVADGKSNATAPHNTDTLRIFRPDESGTLIPETVHFPDRDFYKARLLTASYQ